MSDRELLELAAKAAGFRLTWGEKYIVGDDEVDCTDLPYIVGADREEADSYWNPLEDDADALRLAVKLRLTVKHEDPDASCAGIAFAQPGAPTLDGLGPWFRKEWHRDSDPYAATRRAITRAAAEIGKAQP